MTDNDVPGRPAVAAGADTARYRTDEDERPSNGVFVALRTVSDDALDPEHPLDEHIDLDALDDLFARADGPAGHVEFVHRGFGVRVTADGTVLAWRTDEAGAE